MRVATSLPKMIDLPWCVTSMRYAFGMPAQITGVFLMVMRLKLRDGEYFRPLLSMRKQMVSTHARSAMGAVKIL